MEHDPVRIEESRAAALAAGVSEAVTFRAEDFYTADLRDATVVTLYQLQSTNLKLRKRLQSELSPGARVVSHAFDMGDWAPDETVEREGRRAYLWIVRERAAGSKRRTRKKRTP